MSARDDILARVRAATQDIQEKDPAKDVPITWAYNQPTPLDDVLETFVENILDYKAKIVRTPANGTGDAIVAALRELGAQTVVVPDGAPASWVAAVTAGGLEVIRDQQLSHQQLNSIDAVLTGSRVSMAAEDQGRRALTLVPDRHVCVVTADSVVSDVPEAVHRLKSSVQAGRPITWISGGSATSDIELSRVEGVHGPRKLFVILEED